MPFDPRSPAAPRPSGQELLDRVMDLIIPPQLRNAPRLNARPAAAVLPSTRAPQRNNASTPWPPGPGPDPEANIGYGSMSHDQLERGPFGSPVSATGGPNNSVLVTRSGGTQTSRTGGTRAWRNNNPGNLGAGSFARNNGAIGSAGRFAVFPDVSTGANAITSLLRAPSFRQETIGGAIAKYAPPNENDTARYIRIVEQHLGVSSATPMTALSDAQLVQMTNAIMRVEGWKTGQEVEQKIGQR
jgi:hypothetical protein